MIFVEPFSVYVQTQFDRQYFAEVAAAKKAATPPPLPAVILDDPSDWDAAIMDLFLGRIEPLQISKAATILVKGVKTYSREDRRLAWTDAVKRLNLFLRTKVLVRHKRNFCRLSEVYRPRNPILPTRCFVI